MTQLAKQQNWALPQLKNLPNITSKEVALYTASLQEKKIKEFSTNEELFLLNSIVVRWATNLGITIPEPEEINTISNFIKDNFPNFNSFDLQECVLMISLDNLEFDSNHYGKLSIIYISKALKAFQSFRSETLFKIRGKLEKLELEKSTKLTAEQKVDSFKRSLLDAKETVTKKELYYDWADILYYFFWNNNLVEKPMKKEFEEKALEFANSEYKKEKAGQTLALNPRKIISEDKANQKDSLFKFARQYCINEWLKTANIEAINKSLTIEMINK